MTDPATATPRPAFKDPKPTAERIAQLAERVLHGDILLPRFQRSFVWSRKQILELLDSVGRNYPIGSMLLWQSSEELANERTIADLSIAKSRPGYPVNYLLDGQQRLSTICGALHWTPGPAKSIWNLVYDLRTERFLHSETLDEPPLHQIPLRHLSNPSVYFARLVGLTPQHDLYERAQRLFNRFTDYQVAIVTLGDVPIKDVAPVFERINSTGTPLTIVDLMRAATWSPTFDLVDAIQEILTALEPKNFSGIDQKTLLRAIAAAAGLGFSSSAIDDLRRRSEAQLTADVRAATEAAKRAADFLATEIGVPQAEALPYVNQFAVLTELFRNVEHPSADQHSAITRWFWRTTLSSYFAGWNTGDMSTDFASIGAFASNGTADLNTPPALPSFSLWINRQFRSNSATSKMLALMLAHELPVDLLTAQRIDVGKSLSWSNDKEFHHLFPKAYLARNGISASKANAIANIILLTSHSNIQIRDRSPSEYLSELIEQHGRPEIVQRLATSLVPEPALDAALANDYNSFLAERAAHLQSRATGLCGVPLQPANPADGAPQDEVTDDTDVNPAE